MTTIARVAEEAGVGVGTVSRVLNGSAVGQRGDASRASSTSIEELGYEPNAAARALSTGRTSTLGVVAPFFTQPSVVERLRGVVARRWPRAGYQIVLFDVEPPSSAAPLPLTAGRAPGRAAVRLAAPDRRETSSASRAAGRAGGADRLRAPARAWRLDRRRGRRAARRRAPARARPPPDRLRRRHEDEVHVRLRQPRRAAGYRRALVDAGSDAGLELVVRAARTAASTRATLAATLLARARRRRPRSSPARTQQALGVLEAAEARRLRRARRPLGGRASTTSRSPATRADHRRPAARGERHARRASCCSRRSRVRRARARRRLALRARRARDDRAAGHDLAR